MTNLIWYSWLFPFLFILHDMEEIVTAKKWCSKNFTQHIPLPITPFGNTKTTSGFAVGVYEELILWCIVTLIGNISGFYGLWYGLLVMNILHLIFIHIILLPLAYRRYVPGQITAWLTLIPSCYIVKLSLTSLHYSVIEQVFWISISIVFSSINLRFLHKNINKLDQFISF